MRLSKEDRKKYVETLDNESLKNVGEQILDEDVGIKVRKVEHNLYFLKVIFVLALFGGTCCFVFYTFYVTITAGETMQEKMYERIHDVLDSR